jgi:hypothetical protein
LAIEDLEAQIDSLKKAADKAHVERMKALAEQEAAEEELARIRANLEHKYGISEESSALRVLQEKKKTLADLISKAAEELKSA